MYKRQGNYLQSSSSFLRLPFHSYIVRFQAYNKIKTFVPGPSNIDSHLTPVKNFKDLSAGDNPLGLNEYTGFTTESDHICNLMARHHRGEYFKDKTAAAREASMNAYFFVPLAESLQTRTGNVKHHL